MRAVIDYRRNRMTISGTNGRSVTVQLKDRIGGDTAGTGDSLDGSDDEDSSDSEDDSDDESDDDLDEELSKLLVVFWLRADPA
ncbi:hypothetical protein SPI_00721 [Niveomyces insectorum RCEF 264]|uniref:Uncharacterized protein n=1 Tax=Niveomyces insectorum RCEF 264 TaxID=1081102 RepID=A0A168ABL2_9HYPO|nr:hypothetical protein SPI_00721 [Niveomyces insectorum RCEF 264]